MKVDYQSMPIQQRTTLAQQLNELHISEPKQICSIWF